eukprot:TRINITY_DN1588_c0_g1_i2.p1 TRINITY_DN1588_c0_g1~~TRINITY_DN1588_c0_g1_i2.p1  ORF type:complete len:322 (-),score=84.35 TRINITY_DN1588_c0_g1_i2:164-1129(-)
MKFSPIVALLLFLALSLIVTDVFARKAEKRNLNGKGKGKSKSSKSSSDDDDKTNWAKLGKKTEAREKRSEIQRQKVIQLYHSIIWPTSAQLAVAVENGNYSVVENLMTADVQGRISPLGRFDTYVATGEYFFGLAGPLPGIPTAGRTRVTTILFDKPIMCTQNSCSWRMVASLRDFNTNLSISNYTHIGYANFNSANQICSYEVTFLGLERKDAPESTAARNATMNSLCNGIMASCPAGTALQQFSNFSSCVEFMRTIPYGGWGQADQNTQQCRLIHLQLVRANPATHCPHTGPTGGGKCIFHPESSYHGENFDQCRDTNW